jgi:predicted TPR repeat methyltransferase
MKHALYWDAYATRYLYEWQKNDSRKTLNILEREYITNIIARFGKKKFKKNVYVDLGCGPGRIIDFIRAIDPGYKEIIGIDSSSQMIQACKRKFRVDKRVRLVQKNVTALDTISKKVDVITCIRVMKYIPDRYSLFLSVTKTLNANGVFIFSITNKYSIAYFDVLRVQQYKDSLDQIVRDLNRAGLQIKDVTGYQRMPEIVYTAAAFLGLSQALYGFEKNLSRFIGNTFFMRALYIAATKRA